MTRQDAIDLIKPLVRDPAFLVDVEIAGGSKGPLLRIFLDTDQGITIDECMQWSRELGTLLEVHSAFPGRYTLEVSSPGLGRPLRHPRQYRKNIGEMLTVVLQGADGDSVTGQLVAIDGEDIRLQADGGEVSIALSEIQEAKVKIKW